MGAINNLSQPNFSDINRRLKALENAAPMNNGAVGRSGFEVYDGGNINISNGSITINGALTGAGSFGWTGPLSQSGTSTFTGTTNLNGPTNVAGAFTVTGVTKLNGNTTVGGDTTVTGKLDATGPMSTKGTLSVEGVTTLKNNLNVVSGGKITAGSVVIDPTTAGGSVRFPNNQSISAEPSRLVATSLKLTGTLEVTNAVIFKGLQPTTQAANVYYDPASGTLFYKG